MIEGINPIYTATIAAKQIGADGIINVNGVSQTRQEFMTIFYKEMLKQVMKTPNFGLAGDGENGESRVFSTFNSDLIVEQLAAELARKNALNIPNVVNRGDVTQ